MHAELGRLRADLATVRLDLANRLSAIRACLAAHAEGEDDPLWYLSAELDVPVYPAAGTTVPVCDLVGFVRIRPDNLP